MDGGREEGRGKIMARWDGSERVRELDGARESEVDLDRGREGELD